MQTLELVNIISVGPQLDYTYEMNIHVLMPLQVIIIGAISIILNIIMLLSYTVVYIHVHGFVFLS